MLKTISSLAIIGGLAACLTGCAPSTAAAAGSPPAKVAAPAREPAVIPSGTIIRVRLDHALSTETSRPGDRFSATLNAPVAVDNQTLFPAGSTVRGIVRNAAPSGRLKGRPVLTLALESVTVQGRVVNIATTSRTSVGGDHKKRNWGLIGGGAATGATIGALAGGGAGAAIGAGSGAAAGLAGAAITGKKHVRLPAESLLTFRLVQPVAVKPS